MNPSSVPEPVPNAKRSAGSPDATRILRPVGLLRLLFPILLLPACDNPNAKSGSASQRTQSPYTSIPEAAFVGAEQCRVCHQQEFAEWLQSDHHRAMLPAVPENVLGDFDDVVFTHFGRETRFFRKGDEFWVTAEDENGNRTDFPIRYTFGHYPLQQYLIPFPRGRYQALQVCWDSRPSEEGGQRWFHLYPDEEVPPEDILHWTKRHFNWNYMCADCHSTNLRKNFDPKEDAYHTEWSEINVSCEACHGPGSTHIAWAQAEEAKKNGTALSDEQTETVRNYLKSKGLAVRLKESSAAAWISNAETGKPERSIPLQSNVQVETCARCHSHRQLLEPHFVAGSPFFDTHLPSVLTDSLYHHDGQVDEEVYVYGSYVQSKMYHAGVRCTDCHHPHTMKPLAQGNALCVRCHEPQKYDSPSHHFHQPNSTGAKCVECHMPAKHYMVVDPRRDHSLRIPRPDLAKKLGTPDACTNCHQDKTIDWAEEAFFAWWGKGPRNAHYGETLASARIGNPGALDRLTALAADRNRPGIVRASAVEQLGLRIDQPDAQRALEKSLADPDPAVRSQAAAAFLPFPPAQKAAALAPLLDDPHRAVRSEAARVLADATANLTESQRVSFQKAAREFVERQRAVADRASGHMGLGLFYHNLGDVEKALSAYRDAKRIEPEFVPARINLAELLFDLNRPKEAEKEIREAIRDSQMPENEGQARDALARLLVRMKRHDEGIAELAKAAELLPNHAETLYFYAVALNQTNRFEEALPYLERALTLAPYNEEYLTGAAAICRDHRKYGEALKYAERALMLRPQDLQLRRLVESLRAANRR